MSLGVTYRKLWDVLRTLHREWVVVYTMIFNWFWIVMVIRLTVGNVFCLQDHVSYKKWSHLLVLVNQEKHHLKQLSLYNRRMHISRAIVFRVLVGIFPLVAFLISSIIVWYVSHGNTCWKLNLVSDVTSFICLALGWFSKVSKFFSESILFREFSKFHAGIFYDFVIFMN